MLSAANGNAKKRTSREASRCARDAGSSPGDQELAQHAVTNDGRAVNDAVLTPYGSKTQLTPSRLG